MSAEGSLPLLRYRVDACAAVNARAHAPGTASRPSDPSTSDNSDSRCASSVPSRPNLSRHIVDRALCQAPGSLREIRPVPYRTSSDVPNRLRGHRLFASIATDSRSCRRTAASKSLRDRRPRFVFRPATALPRAALGPFCTGPSSGVYRAHPDASLWTAGTRHASSRRSAAPHRDQASRSPSGSFDRRRPREMESAGKIPVARPSKQRHRAFTYGHRPPIITAQSSCSREHRSEVRRWRN